MVSIVDFPQYLESSSVAPALHLRPLRGSLRFLRKIVLRLIFAEAFSLLPHCSRVGVRDRCVTTQQE